MLALAHLVTLLSMLVAVSRATDVAAGKPEDVDPKFYRYGYGGFSGAWAASRFNSVYNPWGFGWGSGLASVSLGLPWLNTYIYNNGCYGVGFLRRYGSLYFVKATEEEHNVARRAIPVGAEQLVRRETGGVTCISDKGVSDVFSPKECIKAAHQLAAKKTNTATEGTCTLHIVTANEKVAPSQASGEVLEKAVESILAACGKAADTQSKNARRAAVAAGQEDDNRVALLISKAK
ncbi:hypothetical protein MJO28_002995 [Puccinia striiformis f. sp. tritici]|uniref:Uncharacterized protein n=4 Tax=Puccinia striiformis TaxID=27350 RepID=A0A0L0VAI7_9BASI|nr:hypothetical protein MJO28_002995 [Puccinia striiformis f. sp. tritici]KNE96310.1 hypothetical protein PSTG_10429 [Puccinia striiformis f. sp. tritici PST-78]POW09896.1 hypothetical protein PSTT_06483 [Puccinia striiformis]POW21410.1 hypothetical protein PSHT_02406 [Puccinia striiformis]